MSDTYQFEDVEISLNENTCVYVHGEVEYDAYWECGDFDYEGPQGTATHRVGMELTDITIEDVTITEIYAQTKIGDSWYDLGGEDKNVDKELIPILAKKVEEHLVNDRHFTETVQEAGEPEYDPC